MAQWCSFHPPSSSEILRSISHIPLTIINSLDYFEIMLYFTPLVHASQTRRHTHPFLSSTI
jgi:hypothetical protein